MTLSQYRTRYICAPNGQKRQRWAELRAAVAAALANQRSHSYRDARGAGVEDGV